MATTLSKLLLSASLVITGIAIPAGAVQAKEVKPAITVAQQPEEAELSDIEQRLQELEAAIRKLRQGRIVLTRQEVLSSRVVRVLEPEATQQAINLMLQEANKAAVESLQLENSSVDSSRKQVIQISLKQVEKLKQALQDGDEYIVRILSAGNYVQGESKVSVFADFRQTTQVFSQGERLAQLEVDLGAKDDETVREQLRNLLDQARLNAREAGVVSGRIIFGKDDVGGLVRFHDALKEHDGMIKLQVVTSAPVSTAGPLRVDIQAFQSGAEILTTASDD